MTQPHLKQANEGLDQTNVSLGVLTNRVVEGEIRTATAITALAGTLEDGALVGLVTGADPVLQMYRL